MDKKKYNKNNKNRAKLSPINQIKKKTKYNVLKKKKINKKDQSINAGIKTILWQNNAKKKKKFLTHLLFLVI